MSEHFAVGAGAMKRRVRLVCWTAGSASRAGGGFFQGGNSGTKTYLQTRASLRKAPRWGAHGRKRPRKPLPGMMLHQDGSRHGWIPAFDRALDLIITPDV